MLQHLTNMIANEITSHKMATYAKKYGFVLVGSFSDYIGYFFVRQFTGEIL